MSDLSDNFNHTDIFSSQPNQHTSLETTLLSLHTLITQVSQNVNDLIHDNKILHAKIDSQNENLEKQFKRLEDMNKLFLIQNSNLPSRTDEDAIYNHDDDDDNDVVGTLAPLSAKRNSIITSSNQTTTNNQFKKFKRSTTNNSRIRINPINTTLAHREVSSKHRLRQRDTIKRNFKFQIPNVKLKKIEAESTPIRNQAALKSSVRFVNGHYMSAFEDQVRICENMDNISIQKRHGVIYMKPFNGKTNYLRVNGDCKLCDQKNNKDTAVKYVFTIKEKPSDSAIYANVECVVIGEHDHTAIEENRKQIRPENSILAGDGKHIYR